MKAVRLHAGSVKSDEGACVAASSTSACAHVIRNAGDNGLVTVPPGLVIFVEPVTKGDERPNECVPPLFGRPGCFRGEDGANIRDISSQSDTATEAQPLLLEELHRGLVRRLEVDIG